MNKTVIKKLIGITCMILLMLSLYGCAGSKDTGNSQKETKSMYQQISQEDAKQIMDTESDIIILDVRTEGEYEDGHIEGAICIPNETIDEKVTDKLPDKEQTILVYCRSGNRSKQAAQKLADLGYTDIREFGGITSWKYEVVK